MPFLVDKQPNARQAARSNTGRVLSRQGGHRQGGRPEAEAQALEAAGIVGVSLDEKSHGWGSHVIEFFAVGTAVVPNEYAEAGQQLPAITPVLDIND